MMFISASGKRVQSSLQQLHTQHKIPTRLPPFIRKRTHLQKTDPRTPLSPKRTRKLKSTKNLANIWSPERGDGYAAEKPVSIKIQTHLFAGAPPRLARQIQRGRTLLRDISEVLAVAKRSVTTQHSLIIYAFPEKCSRLHESYYVCA